jgi:hypothetical protein
MPHLSRGAMLKDRLSVAQGAVVYAYVSRIGTTIVEMTVGRHHGTTTSQRPVALQRQRRR